VSGRSYWEKTDSKVYNEQVEISYKKLPKSFTHPEEDSQKTKLFIPNTHRNSDQVRIGLIDVATVGDHIRNSDAVD